MAKAAIGQICSTASIEHNLGQCVRLAAKAAEAGAKALFLPEASDYIGRSPEESLSLAKPVTESPFVLGLQQAAKKHSLAIHVGIHVPIQVQPTTTTTTPSPPQTKLLNRTIWIDETGSLYPPGTYDKLHLFDYGSLRESAQTQAGTTLPPPFATPIGRIGSQICFDLRFPEPAIRLAFPSADLQAKGQLPAQVITYPSAFTIKTGRAHWEALLRARAIECQTYVIAAAQVGAHNERRTSYGHGLAVDPWGRVVCRLGGVMEDGSVEEGAVEALGVFEVDLEEWERVRREMPLVRRTDVYSEI